MTDTIRPKVCKVCHIVLDRYGPRDRHPLGAAVPDQWVHSAQLIGKSDHDAVPVDYDAVPVRTMCDFCYDEVPTLEAWTVPATDFEAPVIRTISVGNWAACQPCAQLVGDRDWVGLRARYWQKRPEMRNSVTEDWLPLMHKALEKHIVAEPRPWQPGDEKSMPV